jgi:hypothetical protein
VQRFLHGEVAEVVLEGILASLAADAEWSVLNPLDQPPERVFRFVYQPEQRTYTFRAIHRYPDRWHFRGSSPPDPATCAE